ncbi:MAG: DUF1643 domain-containing protein [Candidatus Gastranaerophilales bacterium]|nr:DUF1643 domain-containing protein [Candidatus Gastranaerophilales bacterium]
MGKKYECQYIGDTLIDENADEYKEFCAPEDTRNNGILKKFYDKHLFRKSLKCKLRGKGTGSIAVITMNPSFADEYGLDETIDNVKKYMKKINKFSEFEILNVFPLRISKNDDLPKLMKKYDPKNIYKQENDDYIKEVIKKSDKIFLAWGRKFHNDARWIYEYVQDKELYVYNLNQDATPTHFAPQVYNVITRKRLYQVELFKNRIDNWYLEYV